MAQAVIGALRVNLGLNSAEFSKGIKKSQNSLSDFKRRVGGTFKMLAGAMAAASVGLSVAVKGAAQEADKMMKASRSLGEPIEDLSRLAHAAKLSGVEFAGLETSVGRLSKNINDASIGIGIGKRAFDELGIKVKKSDGTLKSAREVLGEIADKFSKMPNGAKKTAMAMDLMGRSGAKMISLLNDGRSSMEALGDEAEKLGLVFDKKTGAASELFNDNLERLKLSLTGLWNRVLKNVIPVFAELTTKFADAVKEGGRFDRVVKVLSDVMTGLARGVAFAFEHLDDLVRLLKILIAVKVARFVGAFAGSLAALAGSLRVATRGMTLAAGSARALSGAFSLFGGPVGATLLAIGGAMHVVQGRSQEAKERLERYASAVRDAAGASIDSAKGIREAASALEDVGKSASMAALRVEIQKANEDIADFTDQIARYVTFADIAPSSMDATPWGSGDRNLLQLKSLGNQLVSNKITLEEYIAKTDELSASQPSMSETIVAAQNVARAWIAATARVEELNKRLKDLGKSKQKPGDDKPEGPLTKQVKKTLKIDPWKGLRKPTVELESAYKDVADAIKSEFGSAFDDIREGTFKLSRSIRELGISLMNVFANRAFDQLFKTPFLRVGGLESIQPRLQPPPVKLFSFDGGGRTPSGPRSGGLDGKGGFPAILHPNETVIDETRQDMSGGGGVLEVRLGEGLEADWLQKSESLAVQVSQTAINDYNRNHMPREAMKAVQKGVKSGKSIRG